MSRLHLEDEHQNGKADTGDDAEGYTAPPRTKIKARQDKKQLDYWEHNCTSIKEVDFTCTECAQQDFVFLSI